MNINKGIVLVLKVVIVLAGCATLAFLLVEPNFEGRNVGATFFEVYFTDPFLVYAYIASIPFFVILCQIFKLLGAADRNEAFGESSLKKLRTIKYCALVSIAFVMGGVAWLLGMGAGEDKPPLIMMGAVATIVFVGIALVARRFERKIRISISTQL